MAQENSPPPKKGLGVLPLILVAVTAAGGAGAYFFLKKAPPAHEGAAQAEEAEDAGDPQTPPVFIILPEILVNLKAAGKDSPIVKASVSVQIADKKDEEGAKAFIPLIVDRIITYLREQNIHEIEANGIEHVRREVLERTRDALRPIKVKKIVFQEFIIQ